MVITVLDHDTLRPDDFEGEAFLALEDVPGVSEQKEEDLSNQADASSIQIRLPLMHPKPNGKTHISRSNAKEMTEYFAIVEPNKSDGSTETLLWSKITVNEIVFLNV